MGRELLLNRYLQISTDCRIYYFWSEDTPFVNASELVRTYSKQPHEVNLLDYMEYQVRVLKVNFQNFSVKQM